MNYFFIFLRHTLSLGLWLSSNILVLFYRTNFTYREFAVIETWLKIKLEAIKALQLIENPWMQNTYRLQMHSGWAHWLSLCSARSLGSITFCLSQQYVRHVSLWSSYLLEHQRFLLNRASPDILPQFILRSPLLRNATNIHDVDAFVSEKTSNLRFWELKKIYKVWKNKKILQGNQQYSGSTTHFCWLLIGYTIDWNKTLESRDFGARTER